MNNNQYDKVLNEKLTKIIKSLEESLKSNVEKCTKEIDNLKSSLVLFKECVEDFTDTSINKNNIITKYTKESNSGSYNLPGVFASTMGSYDIDSMKKDNQELAELSKVCEVAENQKDVYLKMIIRAQNQIKLYLNTIVKLENDINICFEQMADTM